MTALQAILPTHVDSTMMSCFRSCPQKFYLEFILGLRPPGISVDLHAGGCFATAIETVYHEVWHNHRTLDEALLRAHAAFFMAWGDFVIPEYKVTAKTPDRMWLAVEYYFKMYPPLTDHIQPYFDANGRPTFEYSFAIPLEPEDGFPLHPSGEPYLYTGRLDLLGSMYGGRKVCGRDEKTQGRGFNSDWAELWNLRGQFIGYTWALQQLGIDCDTIVARGMSILKGSEKGRETDPYDGLSTQEAIKTYSRHMVDRWYEQLRRDLNRLDAMWHEGYWDYNLAETCTSYGKPCIFHNSCESSTPELWHRDFEVRRWNPLTRGKVEDAA